jgi:mono/diheme cytochrome c family protein
LIFSGALSLQAADSVPERGAYLMYGVVACGNCHNARGPDGRLIDGMELAGGLVVAEEAFTARVPNITPDRATGIGAWSDAEIAAALTQGVSAPTADNCTRSCRTASTPPWTRRT